ncbi:hypothetical protein [Stygiolobus azoricus]|uniref:Uncharacterized protein n=1 Tax=Stygiolobus azoricus TaxID=41675 RepID=A0A650CLN3_9CREN|nr:hypothetical protein [Stygiolobus azoricus]QGR18653.1 hypothetical protein D1868_00665 [Stygiolobus azoricus]
MNKVLVATIAGVLFSLGIAFAVIYVTTYLMISPHSNKPSQVQTNAGNTTELKPYVFDVNVSQPDFEVEQAIIGEIRNNITLVQVPSSIENYTSEISNGIAPINTSFDFASVESRYSTVFYVVPNLIEATPNSTVHFYLYLNMSYYNDPVYTYYIYGVTKNVSVTFLKNVSGFGEYQVNITLGNVKPGTVIFLPVWDIHGYEIEYIIIWVVPANLHNV